MQTFKLSSTKEYPLSRLGVGKIVIRKVAVLKPTTNPHYFLAMPIRYEIKYPNGTVFSSHIHPVNYFNNHIPSAKSPATNVKMNEVLGFCKYTTLSVSNPIPNSTDIIEFEISYEKIPATSVEIYVTETIDGYSFELSPQSKEIILNQFPEAGIARRLLVGRDTLHDFQTIYGTFNTYLLTGITGLSEEDIKKLDYQIISSQTGEVLYSVNKN